MRARPRTAQIAGQRWAQAYLAYAAGAISPTGGAPTNLAAGLPALQAALVGAFTDPRQPAAVTAQRIGAAVAALWVPALFAGAAVGTVLTSAPAAPAVQGALLAAWPALTAARAGIPRCAQQTAAALDLGTRLVIVVDVLPPPAPPVIGPIS